MLSLTGTTDRLVIFSFVELLFIISEKNYLFGNNYYLVV